MHADPNHAGRIWSLLSASSSTAWFGPVIAGVGRVCSYSVRSSDPTKNESKMQELSLLSKITLYILLGLMAPFALIVLGEQIKILRGGRFNNPDGSADDWHEQKMHYGVAFADAFLACPASIMGIILVFLSPRWGYYILALASFWWVWGNVMTTATSLRFHNPRISLMWFITFPFGALVGLAYIVWTIIHFDTIYLP